jgi:hypothetical protein
LLALVAPSFAMPPSESRLGRRNHNRENWDRTLVSLSVPHAVLSWLTRALALVLLLRAVGDFRLVGFFKRIRGSRFARLDTALYSPFCVLLAIGDARKLRHPCLILCDVPQSFQGWLVTLQQLLATGSKLHPIAPKSRRCSFALQQDGPCEGSKHNHAPRGQRRPIRPVRGYVSAA